MERLRTTNAGSRSFLAIVALLTAAALPAPSSAATPDRRATSAYLAASYAFERAALANSPSSNAAVAAYAQRVGQECPGVLASAPGAAPTGSAPTAHAPTKRQLEQLTDLKLEALSAVLATWVTPDREAFDRLAGALRPLRWRDARITRLVREEVVEYERQLAATPLDVCADMRAWVSSGYLTLPASAETARNAFINAPEHSGPSLQTLIARHEDPAQRALTRRHERVKSRLQGQIEHVLSSALDLLTTLGARPAMPSEESASADVVAHGTTTAGTSYTISAGRSSGDCAVSLTTTETRPNGGIASEGECSPGSSPPTISYACREGRVAIKALLAAAVHAIRLRLDNGRTIDSRVGELPASDGGPLAVYYQAVNASAGKPISLTELDAHGHTLGLLKLADDAACLRQAAGGGEVNESSGSASARGQ